MSLLLLFYFFLSFTVFVNNVSVLALAGGQMVFFVCTYLFYCIILLLFNYIYFSFNLLFIYFIFVNVFVGRI